MDNIKEILLDAIEIPDNNNNNSSFKKSKSNNKKNHGAKIMPMKDIKVSKWKKKDNVFDWNNRDFAIHLSDCYNKKYKKFLEVSILGLVAHMNRLKQALADYNGFCDNVVLKDYIEYYFMHWSDNHIQKYGSWSFNAMLYDQIIKSFLKDYIYKINLNRYRKMFSGNTKTIDMQEIQDDYKNGLILLLQKYGIIITINYVIMCEQENTVEVLKKVTAILFNIAKNDEEKYNKIMEVTKQHNPYPDWFVFKKYKAINNAIKKRLENVELMEKIKFNSKTWQIFWRSN